jgi:hypothetical protein
MKANSIVATVVLAGWLVAAASDPLQADELFIERIEPPCFRLGAKTLVTVHGSGVSEARRFWSTLPVDVVEAAFVRSTDASTATFEVSVSENARTGLYGMRVATTSGLSNLHLFAIEDLPIVVEKESQQETDDVNRVDRNNSFENAERIKLPACVVGTSPESDVDSFAIDVKAGQRVSFETVGSRLGKAFDPLVTIFDMQGRRVVSKDNSIGLIFDSRFEHKFARAGRYIVQLRDTRFHGSTGWSYMLRMGRFPAGRVAIPSSVQPGKSTVISIPEIGKKTPALRIDRLAWPSFLERNGSSQRFFFGLKGESDEGSAWFALAQSDLDNQTETEPNDNNGQATKVSVPANLHGIINQDGDEDWFEFELKKGTSLTFRAETRDMGSSADLELILFAPDGSEQRRKDDEGFDDAHFTFKASQDGLHRLHIVDVIRKGGPEFVYRIEVSDRKPRLDLTSDAGRLAIPKGTWQPLRLQIKRSDYKGPVELSLLGAPEGLKLRQAEIPPGEDTFSGIIDVAPETKEGVYTVQVLARGADSENGPGPQTVARTFPLVDRVPTGRGPHGEPFELREDQRRLPPTAVDRIAIVVLPKAPYDFDIEPKVVTLPRYVETTFEIKTKFTEPIDGDVSFVARGGTLESNRLRKPTTEAFLPNANAKQPVVTVRLTSGVNTPIQKHEVTVTGTARIKGRTVFLTRVFTLETKVAFEPQADKQKIELSPGQSTKINIAANRIAPFDGPFTLTLKPQDGIVADSTIEFPAGQETIEVSLSVPSTTKPGKYFVELSASAKIDKFNETARGNKITIIVK